MTLFAGHRFFISFGGTKQISVTAANAASSSPRMRDLMIRSSESG
jgi:hypothetical protein